MYCKMVAVEIAKLEVKRILKIYCIILCDRQYWLE